MITIREARPDDLDAVASLFLRCWHESYASVLPGHVRDVFDAASARALWQRLLVPPQPGTFGIVAVDDQAPGRTVGVSRVGEDPTTPGRGHVFSLYVDPSVQGQGIGAQLLAAADAWFRGRGWDEATLWVFEANEAARRFYARHGWQPDGAERVEAAFEVPELRLRRSLVSAPGREPVEGA